MSGVHAFTGTREGEKQTPEMVIPLEDIVNLGRDGLLIVPQRSSLNTEWSMS